VDGVSGQENHYQHQQSVSVQGDSEVKAQRQLQALHAEQKRLMEETQKVMYQFQPKTETLMEFKADPASKRVAPESNASNRAPGQGPVNVFCRVCPTSAGSKSCVRLIDNSRLSVNLSGAGRVSELRGFSFDYIFGPTVSHAALGRPLSDYAQQSLKESTNLCVFIHGESIAQKAALLHGDEHSSEGTVMSKVIRDIFDNQMNSAEAGSTMVTVSAAEFFMEEVRW
jgi:hypothetical protein